MKFHPKKCKVISICSRPSPLDILPNNRFYYCLGNVILEYADNEKDLGVIMTPNFTFNEQHEALLLKANQQFGLLKRTCNFVQDTKRRRALYLSLVRSQFEHCSPIWRPCNETAINKFENFQKRCIKWILSEEELSYNPYEIYFNKCREAKILPISLRFDFL